MSIDGVLIDGIDDSLSNELLRPRSIYYWARGLIGFAKNLLWTTVAAIDGDNGTGSTLTLSMIHMGVVRGKALVSILFLVRRFFSTVLSFLPMLRYKRGRTRESYCYLSKLFSVVVNKLWWVGLLDLGGDKVRLWIASSLWVIELCAIVEGTLLSTLWLRC